MRNSRHFVRRVGRSMAGWPRFAARWSTSCSRTLRRRSTTRSRFIPGGKPFAAAHFASRGLWLADLAEEYVFAELTEAVTLSRAENEARMRAMTAAKTNVSKMLDDLVGRSRQLRQEEITNNIIERGGRKAGSGGPKRHPSTSP